MNVTAPSPFQAKPPVQAPPAPTARRDNDGDGDDGGKSVKAATPPNVGGLLDIKA